VGALCVRRIRYYNNVFCSKFKKSHQFARVWNVCKKNKLMVICPEEFWRKGNVDIVCERYNIKTFETFDKLVDEIKNQIK